MKSKFKIFVTLLLAVVMGTTFVGCNKNNNDNKPSGEEGSGSTTVGTAQSFVSIDINPSIELTVDENDLVVSVYGANEDGQILLHGETDLEGEDVEEVIEKITDLAVEYGYLTEDNKVVNTSVTSKDNQKASALKNKIHAKITARGEHYGFEVKVDGEGTFSLMREYEKFLAEHPEYEGVLSIDKFKLAFSVAEEGDIEITTALELEIDELIALVKELHDEHAGFATEDFKKATKEAERIYNRAVDGQLAKVYDDFYKANLSKYPITGLYRGKLYYAYKIAEIGFDCLSDTIELHHFVKDIPLDTDQIATVLEELGIEDIALLQGKDEVVTIKDIEHFIDKAYKNIAEGVNKDALKESFEELLDGLELGLENNIELSQYNGDFNLIKTQVTEQLNLIKTMSEQMPIVPQEITTFISDMETLVGEMKEAIANGIDKETLEDFEEDMENGADAILELIEEELSEEDLDRIEDMLDDKIDGCKGDRDRFEQAISRAEQTAKDYLENKKEEMREHFGHGGHQAPPAPQGR